MMSKSGVQKNRKNNVGAIFNIERSPSSKTRYSCLESKHSYQINEREITFSHSILVKKNFLCHTATMNLIFAETFPLQPLAEQLFII